MITKKSDYLVVSSQPVPTAEGAMFGNGETISGFGFDSELPDNKRLIEAGDIVRVGEAPEPTVEELRQQAKDAGIRGFSSMNKEQLQAALTEEVLEGGEDEPEAHNDNEEAS